MLHLLIALVASLKRCISDIGCKEELVPALTTVIIASFSLLPFLP